VLTGFAVGSTTAIIPTYISESAVPSIRGVLTGFFEISYQMGALAGFWVSSSLLVAAVRDTLTFQINYGINQTIDPNTTKSWRIPMAIQLIPVSRPF
jgi:MFS family permease